jgi:hypothetical protein
MMLLRLFMTAALCLFSRTVRVVKGHIPLLWTNAVDLLSLGIEAKKEGRLLLFSRISEDYTAFEGWIQVFQWK